MEDNIPVTAKGSDKRIIFLQNFLSNSNFGFVTCLFKT